MRLKVEYARLGDLAPYANNSKEHPSWQVEQIANSIDQFGFNDPVGVWTNPNGVLEIVEGHGRVMACKELGWDDDAKVPIVKLDHLDDDARRAYVHVHNQTTLTSGLDSDMLEIDMEQLGEFDWEAFGFESGRGDWFETRDRNDDSREEGNDEYNEFLDKFEPKKTTDDCYTPDIVYDAILGWVKQEYGISESTPIVRPFYPGGDYQNEDYPEGCIVVDNPPFSIEAQIVRFYMERGIKFFIFCPTLTAFSGKGLDVCYIVVDGDITYENGATVNTSFITNLEEDTRVRTAPKLNDAIMEADQANRAEIKNSTNLKYEYPPYVITAVTVCNWSKYGVDFRVSGDAATRIRALDAQKALGKAIYGYGFLLSERAKEEVERAKALEAANQLDADVEINEQTGGVVWRLSDREMEIVAGMGDAE